MKYWIEFDLRRATVELPDDLEGEALDKALEKASRDVDVEALVMGWDAGEIDAKGHHVR
jgi:hypothetical protein